MTRLRKRIESLEQAAGTIWDLEPQRLFAIAKELARQRGQAADDLMQMLHILTQEYGDKGLELEKMIRMVHEYTLAQEAQEDQDGGQPPEPDQEDC